MNDLRKQSKSGLLGAFLIVIGAVLLLDNLDYIPGQIGDIIFTWPMIFIAIGIFNLLRKQYSAAIVTLAVGGVFIAPYLFDNLYFKDVFKFWPAFLILAGVTFYFKRKEMLPGHRTGVNSDEYIDEVDIFGGGVTQVESMNFKGGKITAIFGGGEVYMDRCKLSPDGAVLDIAMVFGGSKIIVPRDWNVKTEVVSIFGGFADKRNFFSDQPHDPSRTIIIKGLAIFGGGEIRSI